MKFFESTTVPASLEAGLCDRCQHRLGSRLAVEQYRRLNPGRTGLINDIAPKAECKLHEGYGRPVENKKVCRDFAALDV